MKRHSAKTRGWSYAATTPEMYLHWWYFCYHHEETKRRISQGTPSTLLASSQLKRNQMDNLQMSHDKTMVRKLINTDHTAFQQQLSGQSQSCMQHFSRGSKCTGALNPKKNWLIFTKYINSMITQEVSSTNASQPDKIGGNQDPPWILKPFPFKPC